MDGLTWRQWLGRQLSICNGRMAQAISQWWLYGNRISLTVIDRFIGVLQWLFGNGNKMDWKMSRDGGKSLTWVDNWWVMMASYTVSHRLNGCTNTWAFLTEIFAINIWLRKYLNFGNISGMTTVPSTIELLEGPAFYCRAPAINCRGCTIYCSWSATIVFLCCPYEPSVVSCKHGAQDVCMGNKVHKYHSMCKMAVCIRFCWDTMEDILSSIKIFY